VLVGAGLLLRTLFNLQSDHGGLEIENVLTLELPYSGRGTEERRDFYGAVLERAAALPGVRSAAWGSRLPLEGAPSGLTAFVAALEYELEARPTEPGEPSRRADFRPVSSEYFSTLGLTLLQGRLFRATDDARAPAVVVINRSLAEHLFGDADPVGHRIGWRGDILRFIGVSPDWRTIVGVVSDSADYGVGRPAPHVVYHPWEQEPSANVLFLRTPTPEATARAGVAGIRERTPEQPVENVQTLEQVHSEAIAPQRLNATLVGSFALLALAIAAVGIGGVLAFGVSERRRELGVRAALGADRRRLVGLVLGEGALLAVIGLVAGAALSLATSRLLSGLLFGIPANDPLTLGGVAVSLLLVALLASWAPAQRASRVDPARALRAD
jgi:predicted permease